MPRRKIGEIIGTKVGRLIIKKEVEPKTYKSGKVVKQYFCECDCGSSTVVVRNNLVTARTKSCGCMKREHIETMKREYGW